MPLETTPDGVTIRRLQAQRADAIAAAATLNALDTHSEDQTRQLDGLMANIGKLNSRIAAAEQLANASAGLGAGGVTVRPGAVITTGLRIEDDPKRGFASFGHFAMATRNFGLGNARDERVQFLAAAPGTSANEGAGADGGLLIPPAFSTELFKLSLGEDSLIPLTSNVELEASNSMAFPKTEQTPWGTNGVRAYWQAEQIAATATKPALSAQVMRLHKLFALLPVTDELLGDARALETELLPLIGDSIRWKANEAILFGNGNGQPLGAMSSGALITVAKESGQATLTLQNMNVAKMAARLPNSSNLKNQVWVMNNDALPYLWTLNANNQLLYLPYGAGLGAFQGAPNGTLLGRTILVSQHAPSFTAANDISLLDLSYYRTITKAGGAQMATSMHLYFDADATAFRVTFRIDGGPKIAAPIQPAKGSNTLSPFVGLAAR